jgi:hypothetical protein
MRCRYLGADSEVRVRRDDSRLRTASYDRGATGAGNTALEPGAQILLLSRRSHLPAGELVYVDFHTIKDLPLDVLIEILKSLIESSTQSPESAA